VTAAAQCFAAGLWPLGVDNFARAITRAAGASPAAGALEISYRSSVHSARRASEERHMKGA
jgi:hypothetical protein